VRDVTRRCRNAVAAGREKGGFDASWWVDSKFWPGVKLADRGRRGVGAEGG
jgi:hypothetical protein